MPMQSATRRAEKGSIPSPPAANTDGNRLVQRDTSAQSPRIRQKKLVVKLVVGKAAPEADLE